MKNKHAVELGKLGGKVGGLRRAELLSPERRSEIARNAAKARWAKAVKEKTMKYPRGRCSVCGREVSIKSGKAMYHKWLIRGRLIPCSGVGRIPAAA